MDKLKKYKGSILVIFIIISAIATYITKINYDKIKLHKELLDGLVSSRMYYFCDGSAENIRVEDNDVLFDIVKGKNTTAMMEYLKRKGYEFDVDRKNINYRDVKKLVVTYTIRNDIDTSIVNFNRHIVLGLVKEGYEFE